MQPSVLIIDDSLAVASEIKDLLVGLGLNSIKIRTDSIAALKYLRKRPGSFQAVFVNLQLSRLDGSELMNQLDKMEYRGGVVIVSDLDDKIVSLSQALVEDCTFKLLGTISQPFELSKIAFIVKRIRYVNDKSYPGEDLVKRRELKQSLRKKLVVPYYQPKVSRNFDGILGVECLARVDIETRGRTSPEKFLPVAIKFGMYEDFFLVLLDKAVQEFNVFILKTGIEVPLSINLLASQLDNDNLLQIIQDVLAKHEYPSSLLMLEVSEYQALHSQRRLKNLNRFRINGFKISLDGYGSGFTSLRQINTLPLNEVKLDVNMVSNISRDPLLEVICQSVQQITKAHDIILIADGVDDERDLEALEAIGVDGFQGVSICRPKPMDEFLHWYDVWSDLINDREQVKTLK